MSDSVVKTEFRDVYERRAEQHGHQELYWGEPTVDRMVYRRRMGIICRWITQLAPASLLDVGCGEGMYCRWFTRNSEIERVVGVDLSEGRLERARRAAPDAEFHRCDGAALPFADDSFDLVMCSEVIEHVPDPFAMAAELARVSSRYVLISVPNAHGNIAQILRPPSGGEHPLDPLSGHLREYDRPMIQRLLRRSGLKLLQVESCGVYYRGRKKLFGWYPRRFDRILATVDATVSRIYPWLG